MYQDLFTEGKPHKIFVFDSITTNINDRKNIKKQSTGDYEGDILCRDCENEIGKYETYASKIMYGDKAENIAISVKHYKFPDNILASNCANIDYKMFKLFLLSIIWRASISSRSFFNDIKLGPHEEEIRKMILEDNPKSQDNYPIFFMSYIKDKNMPREFIAYPRKIRSSEGYIMYIFIIAGMIYYYFINSIQHRIPHYITQLGLRQSNEFDIIHIPEGQGWEFMLNYYGIKK